MATSETYSTQDRVLLVVVIAAVGGIAMLAIGHPALEPPIFLIASTIGLGVLVRLAAFPSRSGVLFRGQRSIALGCTFIIAFALVEWCPWNPVHSNRGILILALMLLQVVAYAAFGTRSAFPWKHL